MSVQVEESKRVESQQDVNPQRRDRRRLGALHVGVGLLTLAAFLVSGLYMRAHQPPVNALEPGQHLMFTSRHIYMLAAALVNLVLGAYVIDAPAAWARRIQRVGSMLLIGAAFALMAAFVIEPVSGRGRTAASKYGLVALLAGSLLHLLASLRRTAPN